MGEGCFLLSRSSSFLLVIGSCAIQPIRGASHSTSKHLQAASTSAPEASWQELSHPHHPNFTHVGNPTSGPTCILMADQFTKLLYEFCSSAWRRFSICFSQLGIAQERQVCVSVTATRCCGLRAFGVTLWLRASLCSQQSGDNQVPSPHGGFQCCYLIFFFFPFLALSISSRGAESTASRDAALSHVNSC